MSGKRVERRLAAILAADVAGYSRLMGADEAGTLARLQAHRRELIDPKIAEHKGRIVKTTGDGLLVEFPSVVEAVACAVAVQRGMGEQNTETPDEQRIVFRVGINLGDIILEDGDIFGDGVNIAARLEGLAEPGGICLGGSAHEQVRDKLDLAFEDLGEQQVKNITRAVRVYRIRLGEAPTAGAAPAAALALPESRRSPRYGPALAWAAFCCQRLLMDGRSENREADRLRSAAFARRALEVAGDDPGILVNAAEALAHFGEDIGAMMALVDRALALNPSFARGWHVSGVLRNWAGQPDIAIEHIEAALRLSPRARVGSSLLIIGTALFFSRRFDEAVPKLLLAIQEDPSSPQPQRVLAACYAHMGRLDDARAIIERLRAIASVVISDARFLRNPGHRELYLSGLRLAAGETT